MKLILSTLVLVFASLASAQYATPTREIDVPAKTAFQYSGNCQNVSNSTSCVGNIPSPSVPQGMRAVIEDVNIQFFTTSNTIPEGNPSLTLTMFLNGDAANKIFFVPFQGTRNSTLRTYGFRDTTKFYADAINPPVFYHDFPSGVANVGFSISGHFVKK